MRLRKLGLAAAFALIVVLQSISLGWVVLEDDNTNLPVQILSVFFSLYLFLFSARAVNQEYSAHTNSIIHLSCLTLFTSALLGTTAILPGNNVSSLVNLSATVPDVIWNSVLTLHLLSCLNAITTPTGPALHFPSDRIYSQKTLMKLTSVYPDNVCGVTGPFSHLMILAL